MHPIRPTDAAATHATEVPATRRTDIPVALDLLAIAVCDTARQMARDGLVAATAGNVSARDPASGLIAVTPSTYPYDLLQPDDVAIVDPEGTQLRGTRRPTSELPLHLGVLALRPEVAAIVHTHSRYATAFSVVRRPIPFVCNEGMGVGAPSIDVAEWAVPGTADLGRAAVAFLERRPDVRAFLLANHGVVALGDDLRAAYSLASQVEWEAAVFHLALQIGEPHLLSEEQFRATVRNYAGLAVGGRAGTTPTEGRDHA